jgi:hypothetical protein
MRGHSDPSGALLLGMGAGVWLFFKGFRRFREYQVLVDTPRVPIRSVPMGFVHVGGKAETEQLIQSPISHTPCCFYKVEIDQWHSKGRSGEWRHLATDTDGLRFYVADDTGKILVDAHSAEYDLPENSHCEVNSSSPSRSGQSAGDRPELLEYVKYAQMRSMSERISHWVDKRFEKMGASDNPELEAKREAVRDLFQAVPTMAKGAEPPLELFRRLGTAAGPLQDPEQEQKRQQLLERLRLGEAAQEARVLPFRIPASSPATGRYRLREYLVLPGQQYQISGTCVEDPSAGDARNLIVKGQHEPTFLISARTEAALRTTMRGNALLSILGGAVLTLICLALLLAHFGKL